METKNKGKTFKNQQFFIGIDVHKKSWTIAIRNNRLVLKTFTMNPSAKELGAYMKNHYPGGEYYSVYESGFSGFWIHRQLEEEGIKNIVAAPTEIPTSSNEKNHKSDPVDSRKLSQLLENKTIKGIYIPSQLQQEFRSLVRLRYQLVKSQIRLKNQIKGYLHFYGHNIPENEISRNWSGKYIKELNNLEFNYKAGKAQMEVYLDCFKKNKETILEVVKSIRKFAAENELEEKISLLMSVPGIGYITAVTLFSELMETERFTKFDYLASYCGLIPSTRSSGDKENTLGIIWNHNKYIRQLLVESAWMAVRKDPALTLAYGNLIKRMSKQEAIIRIAKKLLSRISYVLREKKKYVYALVG
jgi:transposase